MRTACTVAPVRKPRACRPAGMLGLRAACSRAGSRRVGAATAMQARSLPSEVHAEACHSVTAHSASAGQVRAPDGGPPGRGARGHRGAAAHMAGVQRARQRRQEADSARRVGPDADLAARRADAPALNRAGQRQGVRSGWGCPAWTGLLLGPVGCHSAGSAAPNPAPVCGFCLTKHMLLGVLPPTRWSSAHKLLQRTWLPGPLLCASSAVGSICVSPVLQQPRWARPPCCSCQSESGLKQDRVMLALRPTLAQAWARNWRRQCCVRSPRRARCGARTRPRSPPRPRPGSRRRPPRRPCWPGCPCPRTARSAPRKRPRCSAGCLCAGGRPPRRAKCVWCRVLLRLSACSAVLPSSQSAARAGLAMP